MRKVIILLAVVAVALCGCFHEWPDYVESFYMVTEGPLKDSGSVEAVGYQNCIKVYNLDVVISSNGATINGSSNITVSSNGDNWVWLDVGMLSVGDVFTVSINDDIKYYEVI